MTATVSHILSLSLQGNVTDATLGHARRRQLRPGSGTLGYGPSEKSDDLDREIYACFDRFYKANTEPC